MSRIFAPRQFFFLLLIFATIAVALTTSAAPPEGKGGGNDKGDDGGTTELPPVRYRIKFPALPADSTGGVWINDINNWGQVVGWYLTDTDTGTGRRAYLYDPALNADQAIDLNTLVTAGLPSGWRIASGVAINDWMIVAGYIEKIGSDPVQTRPFAMDLLADNPVVDLLPDVGADQSYAKHLNENGDIFAVYMRDDGTWGESWIYNPGLYGDPADRPARDGTPIDMSNELPEPLFLPTGPAHRYFLNNPTDTRPAQIAGVGFDGVPFRYTLGDSEPERFAELDLFWEGLGGLNDAGTFTALLYVPREKNRKDYTAPFRYNTALDELPPLFQEPQAINSSGDVLLYDVIYRDDWKDYGYVKLDDLVVGTDTELAVWHHEDAVVDSFDMNDRAGTSDSGQVVGRLGGVFESSILFVLTPQSAL